MNLAILFNTNIPPIIRATFAVPSNALESAMACRVFRDIKLGLYLSSGSDIIGRGNTSSNRPPTVPPRSFLQFPSDINANSDTRGVHGAVKNEIYELSKFPDVPAVVRVNTENVNIRDGSIRTSPDEYSSQYYSRSPV